MQRRNYKRGLLLVLGATMVAAGSGCGSGSSNKAPVPATTAPPATEQPQMGATGVPIDPAKKTVVVVVPPGGEAKTREQQLVQLQAENKKTEERLSKLIASYSDNVDNAKSKAKLSADMSKDLEAYKHQSLQLFKAQQAQAQEGETKSGS